MNRFLCIAAGIIAGIAVWLDARLVAGVTARLAVRLSTGLAARLIIRRAKDRNSISDIVFFHNIRRTAVISAAAQLVSDQGFADGFYNDVKESLQTVLVVIFIIVVCLYDSFCCSGGFCRHNAVLIDGRYGLVFRAEGDVVYAGFFRPDPVIYPVGLSTISTLLQYLSLAEFSPKKGK